MDFIIGRRGTAMSNSIIQKMCQGVKDVFQAILSLNIWNPWNQEVFVLIGHPIPFTLYTALYITCDSGLSDFVV